ncbi:MAG: hypothetical protein IT286_01135 [Proteobacteria bacterium]|nr:hypothetical protein [Pseudomonadota bacterium]
MKAKLLGLDKPMNITNLDQLKRFCDFKEIEFNDGSNLLKYSEIVDFIDDLKKIKNGRITIRGKNGSGKSTMLSHLAEALGRDAFYLPTKSDLIFKSDVMKSSDGQKMLQVVDEISSVDLPKYLILDEWDANLDLENIKTLDQKIAKISQNNVIIEVRHRG